MNGKKIKPWSIALVILSFGYRYRSDYPIRLVLHPIWDFHKCTNQTVINYIHEFSQHSIFKSPVSIQSSLFTNHQSSHPAANFRPSSSTPLFDLFYQCRSAMWEWSMQGMGLGSITEHMDMAVELPKSSSSTVTIYPLFSWFTALLLIGTCEDDCYSSRH